MKKVEKIKEVKCTEFANTIYRIRKERGITQKKLSEIIGVSDRTISKWENGTTVPDLETIKRICKELGISPSAIIKSQKKLKDYYYGIKKSIGFTFNYILKNIFLFGFLIAFIFLFIFFCNNYNTIKIYNITYTGNNITFENGYFFKTKVVNILTLNNIKLDKIKYEPTSTSIELYTYLNGDKRIIYESDTLDNIFIKDNKSYADLLTEDVIKSINNNLYIKINAIDEENKNHIYESKLMLKESFNNNKIFYKNYIKENNIMKKDLNTKSPFLVSLNKKYNNFAFLDKKEESNSSNNNKNKLELLGFRYNEETDSYIKIDNDGGVIEYKPNSNVLKKEMLDKNYKYTIRYLTTRNIITYNVLGNNNKEIMVLQYLLESNSTICQIGKCKNFDKEIDYILSIYKDITQTL